MKKTVLLLAIILFSFSMMGKDNKTVRVGVDASVDCFESSSGSRIATSVGVGVRARWGQYNQWLNLVGGVRYIYGARLSGIQVPVLLNVNLLKGKKSAAYLGAGYEFDFIGTYWGCMKFQAGYGRKLLGREVDFRVFYKPYQGDLGAGITFYF